MVSSYRNSWLSAMPRTQRTHCPPWSTLHKLCMKKDMSLHSGNTVEGSSLPNQMVSGRRDLWKKHYGGSATSWNAGLVFCKASLCPGVKYRLALLGTLSIFYVNLALPSKWLQYWTSLETLTRSIPILKKGSRNTPWNGGPMTKGSFFKVNAANLCLQ